MDYQIGYLIKRVQQALRVRMDADLQAIQLTTAQYATLNALEMTPNASNATLARACFVTPQTMIEIIRGLEQLGYVERQAHPEHGRIIQTSLTALGKERVAQAHQIVAGVEEQLLVGLSDDERSGFASYLDRSRINLEQADQS